MALTDNRKDISKHLSCIQEKYSMSEATEKMKQDGIGENNNNSVLESGFTLFKESIAKPGRIRFDHSSVKASS